LLCAHPSCASDPGLKELHFFDRFWAQPFGEAEVAEYHSHFTLAGDGVVGEWTPRYLQDPWVPALLRLAAPRARLLVLLRDPLERYRSGLTHSLSYDGLPPTALVATDAFARGLYGAQLARLFAIVPATEVLVLQFERCVSDTRAELARTYSFCRLDSAFVPDRLEERRLETAGPKVPVPPAAAEALTAAYAPDLARLAELVPDLDFGCWPTAVAAGLAGGAATY
jgi:hypothetical protein